MKSGHMCVFTKESIKKAKEKGILPCSICQQDRERLQKVWSVRQNRRIKQV